MPERALVDSLQAKVFEAIERTKHLVSLVPPNLLFWKPQVPNKPSVPTDVAHLLGHLLDCLAGFCAAFHAAFEELADLNDLRSIPVNQSCEVEDAIAKITVFAAAIQRGFRHCKDADLSRKIKTAFVPEGEILLTILLGNLEHLMNHKYQLFFYLKLAGIPVGTRDLYRWRGDSEATC